ncbi:MAG TPA: VOC family protein [Coriobacteriia bacterium]|jgi:hypothetical protein
MAENAIIWADIPVTDMARAMKFYSAVLQGDVTEMPGGGGEVALLPVMGERQEGQMVVGADLYVGKPSMDGATVYLNTMGDIEGTLRRAEAAGGKVLQEPKDMGPMVGMIAFFVDSEGNRIGLQQMSPNK